MSDMERKIYVTPESEVVPLTGERLLDDGFSEDKDNAPELNDGELDANSFTLFDEDANSKNLWDE